MGQLNSFSVEVAYATPAQQAVLKVEVEAGATVENVIHRSGILAQFAEIDLATQKVGIFSKVVKLSQQVQAGDRIEIYRPLTIDPKEARRKRAKKS